MANIVFWIAPLHGPVNASRKLVKNLVRAGHRVFYTGIPDSAPLVAGTGIPFVPVFQEWFPEGYVADRKAHPIQGWQRFSELRRRGRALNNFFDALIEDQAPSVHVMFRETQADLLLLPSCIFESILWALVAHRHGVPVVYLTSIFLRPADNSAAPIGKLLVPQPTFSSQLQLQLAWMRFRMFYRCLHFVNRLLTGVYFPRVVARLADGCGYPQALLHEADLFTPRVAAQELVLYPASFDLPGGEHPYRTYAETSIDLDRAEESLPEHLLHGNLPMICCSLGTLDYLSLDRRRAFLQAVVDAASALRPPHQFVIATGEELDPESFREVPPHVLLLKRVPQLVLLRRAVLMITHGGANSVKECAYFAVPMLVFPMGFDQPATAARVIYHGLGLAASIGEASPDRIRQLLQTMLGSPNFRICAAAMSRRLHEAERAGVAMQFIENLLSDLRSTGPLSSHRFDLKKESLAI